MQACGGTRSRDPRIALTGDVALEVLAPYFRAAGWDVYVPPGFGAWRQELLDSASALRRFDADIIFDVTAHDNALAEEVPDFFDERFRAIASMPYSLAGIHAIVEEAQFAAIAAPKKILAVDADGTLWRGVIGEDGPDAVASYDEFQRGLAELRANGVLLVLLSKNNAAGSFMPPRMPLADADFTAMRVNWRSKAENLEDVCKSLNLGLDSVVFVDDNPQERAEMRARLPVVAVPPFPSDISRPAQFLRRLGEYFFTGMGRTDEDRLRAASYAARAHAGDAGGASSVADYLASLELRVKPSLAASSDIPRLAQMAGKTNQFNATTIRRTEEEFAAILNDPGRRVFTFRASDRFGDQGLVCYIIVDLANCRITDFVMSCRAMGRTLEHFAYRFVADALGCEPQVDFTPSAKNAPFAEFLKSGMKGPTSYSRED